MKPLLPVIMFEDLKKTNAPVGTFAECMQNGNIYLRTPAGGWSHCPTPDGVTRVKFSLLHPDAKIPAKAREGDIGFDITAVSITETNEYTEYDTGVAVACPEDMALLIFPRSSITKLPAMLGNSVGVADPNFRGSLKLRMYHISEKRYNVGDRIGQLVFVPVPAIRLVQVEQLDETARGDGSFGSSGT